MVLLTSMVWKVGGAEGYSRGSVVAPSAWLPTWASQHVQEMTAMTDALSNIFPLSMMVIESGVVEAGCGKMSYSTHPSLFSYGASGPWDLSALRFG